MEFVLFVLTAALILFVLWLMFAGGRNTGPEPPSISATDRAPKATSAQVNRFDAQRSQHLDEERVLKGAAYVVDGDTIRVCKTQIRLFGIDAPELNHPYGVRAKRALLQLCNNQPIRAVVTDEDTHGRTVARCYLPDGRDLSAEMVKLGLAIDWPKFSGGKYRHLETPDARRKLYLADARQKGRMHVWEQFEARQAAKQTSRETSARR